MNWSDLAVVLAFVALICGLIYDDNAAAAVRPARPTGLKAIRRNARRSIAFDEMELVRMEIGR